MKECLLHKKSNCKNCYKCIRTCPVKSIRFSDNQAQTIAKDCILCGHCYLACPQKAKEIRNDIDVVKGFIKSGKNVYASIAPAFISNYKNMSFASMEQALLELGFSGIEETAVGATMVAKEYEKTVTLNKSNIIISTCCHTVNVLIQKYYPEIIPNLAPVISPMHAHCKDLKNRYGDIKTVFIGPCISKKDEGEGNRRDIDCVLTFEELSNWMDIEGIGFKPCDDRVAPFKARFFPSPGGILKTMATDHPDYTYLAVDGMDSCINAIKDIKEGGISKCFIEMSACQGSCINGPAMNQQLRAPVKNYIALSDFSGEENLLLPDDRLTDLNTKFVSLAPQMIYIPDAALEDVLKQMGKTKAEHELNCGSCGYNTCREKARAIIDGKADLTMCLPYLKEKAESFSDTIINHTPNAILVVNERFDIQLVNKSACELFNLNSPREILGSQVVCVLDPSLFTKAYEDGVNTYGRKQYLTEYKKYVENTVIYDKNYHIIICIMRDITPETLQSENRQELSRKTIEITDKVIEKQMRTVQEIASLLGETTAETKIALTRLKESLYE